MNNKIGVEIKMRRLVSRPDDKVKSDMIRLY